MDEFIKLLDENLEYVRHELIDNIIYIYVVSIRAEVICPYCGQTSSKVHSRYERSFQDLPIQGKKTKRLNEEIINIALNVNSLTSTSPLIESLF